MTGKLTDACRNGGISRIAARVTVGAICLRSSNHFEELKSYSNIMKPVALPPGLARLPTNSGADWIRNYHQHDWHGTGRFEYDFSRRVRNSRGA